MQLLEEEDLLTLEPLEEQTVGQLVLAAQDGDRDAFGELVRRFEQAVLAIALRRLKNYAEAQELSQEVFVQALRKLDQLREPECFGGWLRSITVRLAINRMVRRQPERGTEPETLAATCIETKTPLTEALASERRRQVRDSLDRLRKLDRETLVAFYVEGQTLIEMSTAFDSPIGTIKRRLHVARKRLARELESLAVA
ncbi:MAG: sigma-70 family RNA polymerase sigma factor [Pirellulales bacterium]|nr:sigma-70 family RNA polymerase sigma factor [Pirellulales bacterium]